MIRLLCAAFAAVMLGGVATASSTQSDILSSVDTATLPAPPDQAARGALLSVDRRLTIINGQNAWLLSPDKASWTPQPLQLSGIFVRAAAGAADQAFALLSPEATGAITGAARLSLVDGGLIASPLPALPYPLSEAHGVATADSLYVAGIDSQGTARMLQLPLATPAPHWNEHPGWPGNGAPTSFSAQLRALYLTVTTPDASHHTLLKWTKDAGWTVQGDAPGRIVSDSGRAVGQAHVLYLVTNDSASTLMSFHTISGSWAPLPWTVHGDITGVAPWERGLVAATAQSGRTILETAELRSTRNMLTWLDWSVVIVYLGAMLAVGVYWYFRDKHGSATDFFVGSRTIPFWAAGVSLYATNTSSISYIAIPAKAFETDWQYMNSKIMTVLGLMFVAVWIVPLLRRLNLVSVFNYLEMRFHPAIRMLASALCMLMHVGGRMSVVLFLPALAIATITGIDVVWSILIMGLCTIVYTAMGGMRAVVWTDFVQVIVLMGGAIFAIGFIFDSLGGAAIAETAAAFDKTRLLNFSFDLTEPTVWGFFFLILFDTVLSFPKDQVLMQRTLATKSDKEAGRSIWMFAAIMLPGGLIFYGIGTVLFAYYKQHPERLDPLLPIDATFPLFIAAELPSGLTGLIIAGIFAAAMGTLSGTINSVATLLSVDFYEKLARNPTQKSSLRFAEWMTVVIGLIGIALALLLSRYDIHSLLDLTIELAGLLGGGFAGAYTLGMFTRRANSAGVSIGVGTAIVVTFIAWWNDLVHPYFYLGISIAVCIVVGYLASLLFPPPSRSLAGLTIYKEI